MIRVLRSSKTEQIMFLTFLKSISFIFLRNELRLIEYNNSFATRRRSAEIIKKKNLKIIQKTWQWKNFSNFLINLIKNLQNHCFVVAQKHDIAKQSQSQNVNDFVIYVEIFETDFDEFISIQQRNYLLNRLKKKIKKKFNTMINIF